MSLLNMVNAMGLVPAKHKALYDKCLPKFKTDICETILPRCSDTCQPLQSCKSSCMDLQKECIPENLVGMLSQVLPGGSFRGMIGMVGLSEGSPAMKMLDAWVGKMSKCESPFLSKSDAVCLTSDYNKKQCDPTSVVTKPDEPEKPEKADEPEKTEKPEKPKVTSVTPSPKCIKIDGFKSAGCFSNSFYGSVADGFSLKTFKQGSDKLMSLLNMVNAMGLVPAKHKALYDKCLPKFKTDICETILPRCSDTCQPLQSCKSSCMDLQKECIPENLVGMLSQVLP